MIGVISAFHAEARSLVGHSIHAKRVFPCGDTGAVVVSGIGTKNTEHAITALLEHGATVLVSWGIAGALVGNVRPGDIVLAEAVIAPGGARYPCTKDWCERIATRLQATRIIVHRGALAHTDTPLRTPADKARYQQLTGALAVDMESIAVARRAAAHRLPCVAVRAIVDAATDTVPETITRHIDPFGTAKHGAILMMLLKQPRLLPTIMRLANHMRRATSALTTVARTGVPFAP